MRGSRPRNIFGLPDTDNLHSPFIIAAHDNGKKERDKNRDKMAPDNDIKYSNSW